MPTFGERLKALRIKKGLNQEELAKFVSDTATKSTISNWETDTTFPNNYNILIKLADIFDCTIDYLLGRSDFKKGRIITKGELLTFLPKELIENNKLEIMVDDADIPLKEETKREIIEVLKRHKVL